MKILSPRKSWEAKILKPEFMLFHQIFSRINLPWSKNNFNPKNFSVEKILFPKLFQTKICEINLLDFSPLSIRFYSSGKQQSVLLLNPHCILIFCFPFYIERFIFRIWVCCGEALFSCQLGNQGYSCGCIVFMKLVV